MLPGLDSIPATAVLDRLSLLKYRNVRGSHIYVRPSGEHRFTVPKLNGTFAAQTLAGRYDADPSVVRLKSHNGEQYPMSEAFVEEITKLYEGRDQEREAKRLQASLSPQRGPRFSNLSLERFRTSNKHQDRPAAADIAFCVAAYAHGMTEDRIERTLEDDYLSRDPNTSKRAAYIRELWRRRGDEPSNSILASSPVVVLPCSMVINSSSF
jgi:hypothetical protein